MFVHNHSKSIQIAPETQLLLTAASVTNRMIAKEYLGCGCRTVCGKEAAVELQGRIHRVSCKRIPDNSITYGQTQL